MRSQSRSKVGNRPGNPAYRTQALFRYRQYQKVQRTRISKKRRP
ncbi:MAG: hypothetical protein AAB601_00475 [Patescibacteria group bacterium]